MRKLIAVDNFVAASKTLSAFIKKWSQLSGGRYFPVLEDMFSSSENVYMVS